MRISDWSSDVCSSDLRNGWSLAQISRGMHVVRSFDYVSVATLERFARGACSLGREHARPVSTFIADWPEPGPFEEWRVTLAREAVQRKVRSEEHTSELQSLMRISYAVFCWKKKRN